MNFPRVPKEAKDPNHPLTRASDQAAIEDDLQKADAHLLGTFVVSEVPELPPIEELRPIERVPDFTLDQQSALPGDPHDAPGYLPFDRGLPPEEMCQAWGRSVRVARGMNRYDSASLASLGPAKVLSQLDQAITVSRHLACLAGDDDRPPTYDEQVASVVESTIGFLDAEEALWHRYVGLRFHEEPGPVVLAFRSQLGDDWPHGFNPDLYERMTRGEQVRLIESSVESKIGGRKAGLR